MRCGSGSWLSPREERAEVESRDRARVAAKRLLLEVAYLHNALVAAHPAQTSGVDFTRSKVGRKSGSAPSFSHFRPRERNPP